LDILLEVRERLVVDTYPVKVLPYPRGTDDLTWSPDYHERAARQRMDVVQILVRKGILKKAAFAYDRPQHDLGREVKAIVVEAEEEEIDRGIEAFGQRLGVPIVPLPGREGRLARVPEDLKKGFWTKIGGYLAGAAVLVLLALIGQALSWWTAIWRAVRN
jgi:hypothetical protein